MSDDEPDDLDPALEWKLRAFAVPATVLVALVFHSFPAGHQLQRTFLTMLPHEFGHAITAWLTGHAAIPSLWKTIVWDGRSVVVIALVGLANAALAYHGWRAGKTLLLWTGVALGALQIALTTTSSAQAAITFGGDAGAMILGALLVLAFFAPEGSPLRKGGLRWGLLVIGAATIVDTFATWWTRKIPYGEIEGVGLSDPVKLEQLHGWSTATMVDRYLMVGGACIVVVAAVSVWGVVTMRSRA